MRARYVVVLMLAASCGESRGDVFVTSDARVDAIREDAPDNDAAAPSCRVPPFDIAGNDPSLSHACGETCDSDWCNCESCEVQTGTPTSLPAGDYVLTIVGGSSGPVRYTFEVLDDASGEVLASDTVLYDDTLFEHELSLRVPEPGCEPLRFRIQQLDPFCSRIYETLVR